MHQAAYAEYCSLGHNMETPTCAMTRRDREQDELRQAYCDGSLTIAFDKEKTWCKRKELEGALRATPSTARDKRVKIGQELSAENADGKGDKNVNGFMQSSEFGSSMRSCLGRRTVTVMLLR